MSDWVAVEDRRRAGADLGVARITAERNQTSQSQGRFCGDGETRDGGAKRPGTALRSVRQALQFARNSFFDLPQLFDIAEICFMAQ